MTTAPTIPTTPDATTPDKAGSVLLKADDIHKTYQLGRVNVPVLKGASITVGQGEWVSILGASGSGKSTLLHILGDLDSPDRNSGHAMFNGRDIHTMSGRDRNYYRNNTVGFVFQFYHLLPELPVLENAIVPALIRKRGAAWWQLLLLAGIVPGLIAEQIVQKRALRDARDRATAMLESYGLGHRLHHRPRELSGGERQRVAIVRALVNQPQVLLADEPTGNLDEETGAEILKLIHDEHDKGLTIVMVTHDINVANRADRIVRLHQGKVQANDPAS